MSILHYKGQYQVEPFKSNFATENLTNRFNGELSEKFPHVHSTQGHIAFEARKFPITRIWNLYGPISRGEITIKKSRTLSLVSYEIDMSKYVICNIAILFMASILMLLSDFTHMFIAVFCILVLFFLLAAVCISIINFNSFIRKTIGAAGGKILNGV